MCRLATCEKCGLVTWAGCGKHRFEVLRNYSVEQICNCPR